jgi:predicted MFS family arabinose efflux permease
MKPLSISTVALAAVTGHMALSASRVAAALLALHLGHSPATVGLILALYSIVPTLCAVAAGRWIDRVGTKRPALTGYVLCVIGVAAPVLYTEVAALWITALCVGGGWTCAQTAQQNATGRLSGPEHRTRDFTTVSLAVSISSFAGPTLAGFAVDAIGYRAAFALILAFPLTAALAIATRAGLPPSARKIDSHNNAQRGSLLELARLPGLRDTFFITVIMSIAWDAHTFLVPVYGSLNGISASQIGLIMGAFGAATFVIRGFLPRIMRAVSLGGITCAAFALVAIAYLGYPLTQNLALLIALSVLIGFGLGSSQPVVLTMVHDASPPDRLGEAVGLRIAVSNSVGTVLPLMLGAFATTLGLSPIFWTIAALCAAAAWLRRPAAGHFFKR